MKKCLFLLAFSSVYFVAFAQVAVKNLLVENLANPVGLDVLQPRFSWQLVADKRNISQTAYEIKVTDAKEKTVWNSGRVNSAQSVHVTYAGTALQPGGHYNWQVRVWDNDNKPSAWSEQASWQMGLLQPADWKAQWIEAGYVEDSVMRPSPYLRKQFTAGKKIKSATAFITSHGLYEAFINGQRVGDAYLTPGWTSYNKRLQYQAYDVTEMLKPGANAIGVALGSGWYRGNLAWAGTFNLFGKTLGLLMQLDIVYADGSTASVVSDESWKSSTGAVRYSEIYHGETQDARLAKDSWATAGFNDAGWTGVKVKDYPKNVLVATYNETVKKHETFLPISIFKTPKGEQVIDFGQNLVGFVQLKISGKAGDTIKIYHAEVLDKEGNFYTENLRAAKQENVYVLKGGGEETFEPHFTFQGFRYIKVVGFKTEPAAENFTAVALYSDMKPAGTFSTSNKLINQLQHNIQWGQNGNFLDVPTDCPQRDERLGWTGDAQAFSRTASFNRNVNNFFAKWLKDVAADQNKQGSVPFVVPNVLGDGAGGSAGWADAATIIPWNMYLAYADTAILQNQYESMKAWVGYMQNNSTNDLWNKGFHFGDWLFYRPFDDNDGRSAVTDKYLIAQCFYAHSTQLLANAAKVLGKTEDVNTYTQLLQKIKEAFAREYMTPSGRLISGTQTAYALALNFDMLPENLRPQAAAKLAQNVADYDNHLTTGFIGAPYLCHVLSRFGYDEVAFKLLMQETYPSWLYPVKMGATTIWERWDGQKPDSTFQTPGMNSFNHYAYGAIGDWMYRVVAGIDTYDDAPGYKHIRIKPHSGGGLTHVTATLQTYYGPVTSAWSTTGAGFSLNVTIPANTKATVYIPASSAGSVKENNAELSSVAGLTVKGTEDKYVVVEVGSGKYSFTVN
ncbi:alpha-L-rhamnosidase [Foetidibacter luteolus]|uniref:alpha-L-rhamnosidase n=1 Tax=Foetidibacter luteolus TaxID=2608880 RepID=UPI00129B6E7F|nr:alpha-L-rhamnosidase [Foetidibacter luteolus]